MPAAQAQIEAARAERDRAQAAYKEARERAATDPLRCTLGGLAPDVMGAFVAKQRYQGAAKKLRDLTKGQVISCRGCENWHVQGKHTLLDAAARRANEKKYRESDKRWAKLRAESVEG